MTHMKLLLFFFSFTLMSCGGATTTEPAVDTIPSKSTSSAQQPVNGSYPTAEAISDVENGIPIRGDAADFTLTITGATPGRSDLIGFFAEENFLADTTVVGSDGVIHFENPEGFPQGIYYVSFAPKRYLQLMLGKDQKFTISTSAANPDGDIKINGSDENSAFFENLLLEKEGNKQLQAINARLQAAAEGSPERKAIQAEQDALLDKRDADLAKLYKKYPNTLFEKFKRAGANPRVRTDVPKEQMAYYYRQDFWKDVDFSDRRLVRTPVIKNKLERFFKELTPQNHDSIFASATRLVDQTLVHPEYFKFIANWIVRQYEPTKTTLMDPEFVHVKMLQKYFQQDRAFWADSLTTWGLQNRAAEMANSLMGMKGPNVISKDLNGVTHELMASKADYLVVYMFAPSCEHCQEQTPKLVEWYKEWNPKGVDVYAIALDSNVDDPNELANYIKKTNMPFPVIWDKTNRSIYKTYYVDITPEIYVMNPEREIIAKNLKVFQIETMINRDKEKRGVK